ncbi:MAG: transcriptional regulator [Devosia sp.]|uniref:GntR family transcriptional regulator n=1 Tax=Devosia sp. TaxID=1871048 RepID=UPI0026241B73|nr:GntR family transcriptional regulator [Devosia sp.]MDB5541709.1 transcriptional regulator [Devosia sp.]
MPKTRVKATPEPEGGTRDLALTAYSQLKELIKEGALPPGSRVTEADLSSRLGMSRTPVREAIYRLEGEGLLTHEPRRGLTVTLLDHQMILELYTMREVLEGTAARLAAQHASDTEIEALAEFVETEAQILSRGELTARINSRIHALIYLAAHNRHLMRTLDSLTVLSLLPTTLGNKERAEEAHQQHKAILNAIRSRDPDAAELATREHIRSARKHRLKNYMLDVDRRD